MLHYIKFVCFLIIFICFSLNGKAKIVARSAQKPPEWVKKGEKGYNAKRSNTSYYFKIIENTGSSLEIVRSQNVLALASYIGQSNNISSTIKADIDFDASTGEEHDRINISYNNKTSTESFSAKLVDEYWEEIVTENNSYYQYYALFAVSNKNTTPNYDSFTKTNSYGATGVLRSVIPGLGQLYKGSNIKGYSIMIGEALCVGGIIYCESMRSSYVKKMQEQPKHANEYNSLADDWHTGRTICIGAAAAVYVYNLIDAALANGSRRISIKKNRYYGLTLRPSTENGNSGFSLCLNF